MGNNFCQGPKDYDNSPKRKQQIDQLEQFGLQPETHKSQSEFLGSQLNIKNVDNYESRMNDWLESLQDTYYISRTPDKNGSERLEGNSEIQEYDLDQLEIDKYADRLPYCKTNLDVMIINSYIMNKKDFIHRLRVGPPKQRIRWSSWQLLVFDSYHKINCNNLTQEPWNEVEVTAIKKDIRRTVSYKECKYFINEGMQGCADLEYILVKLSKLFPKLGYCQGMNFLGAFILMVNRKQKEGAFEFLGRMFISPKFMLYYLFADDMPLVQFLVYVFNEELKQRMPTVSQHISVNLNIHSAFWVNKVFLTLFLYNFHFTICQRFWDILISSNIFSVVQLLLSLICNQHQKILRFCELYEFHQWFDKFQNNEDYSFFNQIIAESNKYHISRDKINQYAINFRQMNNHDLFQQDFKEIKNLKQFILKNTQMFQASA